MIYKWRNGAHIKADAQVAGTVCSKLEKEGRLTPKNLLNESRPVDAPLHNVFEWDDGIAAEKYRTEQAAHIIRCVITIPDKKNDEVPQPKPAFVLVSSHASDDPKKATYRDVKAALNDPVDKQTVLKNALRELDAFQRKYSMLSELASVFNEIKQLKEKVQHMTER